MNHSPDEGQQVNEDSQQGQQPSVVGVAMQVLSEAMAEDDGLANGWHANIAVLLTDEGVPYDAAQERASGFMKLVFGRETLSLKR